MDVIYIWMECFKTFNNLEREREKVRLVRKCPFIAAK